MIKGWLYQILTFINKIWWLTDMSFVGGKPITPTGDQLGEYYTNGNATHENGHSNDKSIIDGATKIDVSVFWRRRFYINNNYIFSQTTQLQSAPPNGKSPLKGDSTATKTNGDHTNAGQTQISNQVVPGPQSATHVLVDDKKKKKCTCCVIQ